MKKLILTLALCLLATSAFATIDWSGNVWPNSGSLHVPTGPIDVYVQVYKGGVTDGAGQGADIAIDMMVENNLGDMVVVPLTYHGDVGNNDEYTGQVPQALLAGAASVDVDFVVSDLSDGTMWESPVNDQAGNPSPLTYNVTNVLPNDVDVYFELCMSGTETQGPPCVIGSAGAIGAWGVGVIMNQIDGDLWGVTVTFPAGDNPAFEYKFRKDGCLDWESVDNRQVTLPTDGTTSVVLETQSWNNTPIGCGLGSSLEEDKVVCFQVCLDGVENTGGVCVTGGHPDLTNWGDGMPMMSLGGGLYQGCITVPAGTLIPLEIQFKFKKDDCQTWESVDNRVVTVDNGLAPESTVTYTFDDGPGVCSPVATDDASWDGLKSYYR
jgi:hypothetical protein